MTQSFNRVFNKILGKEKKSPLEVFQEMGYQPWTTGYDAYKWQTISEAITSPEILELFQQKQNLPARFGWRIDERIVEYPWLLSNMASKYKRILDAGSALNFLPLLQHLQVQKHDVTIMTLAPEDKAFWDKKISYHYGDLRQLPFQDGWFDEVVSISTIEHISFDNSLYGANKEISEGDYLKAVSEFWRVLSKNGTLYITVPYGQADDIIIDNEIFARQFDAMMVNQLLQSLDTSAIELVYYRYTKDGWVLSNQAECDPLHYFNIHENQGYDEDFVAAARAVCCIKAVKSDG